MTTQKGNLHLIRHLRIVLCQQFYSFNQIIHTFSLICYPLRNEENNFLINR